MANLFGKIETLMNIGERLHFLTAIANAFMGKEPEENASTLEKGTYRLFGTGTDDELRVGKYLRTIAEQDPDGAELFIDFCRWLFTHEMGNRLQSIEAAMVRNGFFVYIAKAGELNSPPKKTGTRTTTVRYSLPDDEAVNNRRNVEEKTVTDQMTDSGRSEAIALLMQIIGMLRKHRSDLPKGRNKAERQRLQEQAFRETQQWLKISRGIPCRKVGDLGLDGWVANVYGCSKPVAQRFIRLVDTQSQEIACKADAAEAKQRGWLYRFMNMGI